jgi:toxin ParE1/3/4
MSHRVFWSVAAEIRLQDIFEFYEENAGTQVAQRLVTDLIHETIALSRNAYIGQVEELLEGRAITYRYLVCGHHKIIYSVDDDLKEVRIADVFDCRQNPAKMAAVR